jgi:hypothetical protein
VGFEPLHYEIPGFAEDDHTLLGVVQTYLGVKDMTFDSEATLVDPYNAYGNRGLVAFVGAGSFELGLNTLLGTDIINVHFNGSLDGSGNPETAHLFQQFACRRYDQRWREPPRQSDIHERCSLGVSLRLCGLHCQGIL